MARRTSFISTMNQIARAGARAQRQAEAAHRRAVRQHVQAQKAATRAAAQAQKEAKQRYIEQRYAEAEDQTEEINYKIEELRGVLQHTLSVDDAIQFDSLLIKDPYPAFNPDRTLSTPIPQPTEDQFTRLVKPPNFLLKLLPGSNDRHQFAIEQAKSKFLYSAS